MQQFLAGAVAARYLLHRRKHSRGDCWSISVIERTDGNQTQTLSEFICPTDTNVFPDDDFVPEAVFDSYVCNNLNTCPDDADECLFQVLDIEDADGGSVRLLSTGLTAVAMLLLLSILA
jgi:hypothetical protein